MAEIPKLRVFPHGLDDRRMQRDQPRLVELGLADHDCALAPIDISPAQLQRLRDTQARAANQAEQRRVSPGSQAGGRRKSPGCGQQGQQFGLRVDVWGGSAVGGAQETLGWDLGRGVKDRSVAREATDHLESPGLVQRCGLDWEPSPAHGQLGRQRTTMARAIGIAGELQEHLPLGAELIAEPTTVIEILLDEAYHRSRFAHGWASGQDKATAARVGRSTLV